MLTALQIAEELFSERRQSGDLRKKIREKSQSLLEVLAREARRMSGDLAEEKRALRRAMRDAREALDAEQRVALTVAAVDRLLALPVVDDRDGRIVAGYVAVDGELSPAGALGCVRDAGGTVALPRVSDAPPRLRFHAIEGGVRLRAGALRDLRAARDRARGPPGRAGGADRPRAGVRRRRPAARLRRRLLRRRHRRGARRRRGRHRLRVRLPDRRRCPAGPDDRRSTSSSPTRASFSAWRSSARASPGTRSGPASRRG